MTMPNSALVVALHLLTVVDSQYQVWTPVDVIPDVCYNAPAYVLVNVSDFGANKYKPHIISMLRTSGNVVSMSISATDQNGVVVLQKTPVQLSQLTGGRLLADATGRSTVQGTVVSPPQREETQLPRTILESDLLEDEDPEEAWQPDAFEEYELEQDDELEEEEEPRTPISSREERSGRSLKKGGGGRRSPPASRRSPPSTPAKSPPKYSPSDPRSYSDARRRANPVTARRRGAPTPTGDRRRSTGVGGTRFDNPSNPSAGAYGYTSPTKLNNNFPSGYSPTSYGYSGANAHKGSSTSKIMMAAAAGGAIGLGTGYVLGGGLSGYSFSRWNPNGWGWRNRQCYHSSSSWSGTCSDCYDQYRNCEQRVDRNAGRDDLMTTGFIPYGYAEPIQFKIEDIVGTDYAQATICPPAGWQPTNTTVVWNPPLLQDIWMTFSAVDELEETLAQETNVAYSRSSASFSIVVMFILGLRGVRHMQ